MNEEKNKRLKNTLLTLLLCFGSITTFSQKVINLETEGIKANTFLDQTAKLDSIISAHRGEKGITLLFPKGQIDLYPQFAPQKELYISNCTENDSRPKVKNIALNLENLEQWSIKGDSTLFMLHGKMVSFLLNHSKDITIEGVAFDYQRPTMTELEVIEKTDKSITLKVHRDSWYTLSEGHPIFYGENWKMKNTHAILCNPSEHKMTHFSIDKILKSPCKELSYGVLQFEGNFSDLNIAPHEVITVRDPYRDNVGALISYSQDITLQNIQMHYMHGLGIVGEFSKNLTYSHVEVAPRSNTQRAIASFADCFHFSGCSGKITIDGCHTSGSHDDAINVHGTYLKITHIDKNGTLTAQFMHHQTYGFDALFAQDSIEFVDHNTLLPLAVATIKEAHRISDREIQFTLTKKLSSKIEVGNGIENITHTPEVIIRNSLFENTDTRGVLLTTRRKAVIENNTFYRTGMHAILIADDCNSWYESGPVRDVTIRNNRFVECGFAQGDGGYQINIAPEYRKEVKHQYVHGTIKIENNEFYGHTQKNISAKGVKQIEIVGNSFYNIDGGAKELFHYTHCGKIEEHDNKFSLHKLPQKIEHLAQKH